LKAASNQLLQIQDLTVTYPAKDGTPLRALERINLSIAPTEIVGVLGESGCGKTTLASAIMGLLPRSGAIKEGKICFRDINLLETPEAVLRAIRGLKVSIVPQEPALALNPVITTGTQIGEVLTAHLRMGSSERKERVLDLLREVGFENPAQVATAYPHQLSGGQRQRIVLAQAISCEPELLIADEPTSKLDATLRSDIASLLSKLHQKRGMAILLISHDVALVASLSNRIVLMYSGRVVETSPSTALVARPLHPYAKELLLLARSSLVTASGRNPHFSVIGRDGAEGMENGCSFEPRCGERMSVCVERVPEEIRAEPARTVSCFKYGE
jgi:oligopeptide/dipeptide ABC transporter ATP-binding protein